MSKKFWEKLPSSSIAGCWKWPFLICIKPKKFSYTKCAYQKMIDTTYKFFDKIVHKVRQHIKCCTIHFIVSCSTSVYSLEFNLLRHSLSPLSIRADWKWLLSLQSPPYRFWSYYDLNFLHPFSMHCPSI